MNLILCSGGENLVIGYVRALCHPVSRSKMLFFPMSSSLAVTSFGLSSNVSDAGLPSEKEHCGYLFLGRVHALQQGLKLILVQVVGLPERLASQVSLE
ncbi:hypothetical protein Tco_1540428 [Tanacetum coccineum]